MAKTKAKERARDRVLSDAEIRAVWNTAKEAQGPFPALIRFLLLTGARRTEASAMEWSEIEGRDWVLPARRHKTKVALTRPLSEAAASVLQSQRREGSRFVFTTDGKTPISAYSKFKGKFDGASGTSGWTLHDLRRSVRSLMSRAGVPSDHAERCLGHALVGIRATYDRHEFHAEKKHAYDRLSGLIEQIVSDPQDNVVPLKKPSKKKRS